MGNVRTLGASVNETTKPRATAGNFKWLRSSNFPLCGCDRALQQTRGSAAHTSWEAVQGHTGQLEAKQRLITQVSLLMRSWIHGRDLAASSGGFPPLPLFRMGKLAMMLVIFVFRDLYPFFLGSLWDPLLSLDPGLSRYTGASILLRSIDLYWSFRGLKYCFPIPRCIFVVVVNNNQVDY